MSDNSPSASPLPASALSTDELLARLLDTYKKPAKVAAPKKPKVSRPKPALPFAQAYAVEKTGYRVWKATHKVIEIQHQVCECCGTVTPAVKGEFFALENGAAHAVWLRTEAYGIEASDSLPVERVELEARRVSACAFCADVELRFRAIFPSPQLSFDF